MRSRLRHSQVRSSHQVVRSGLPTGRETPTGGPVHATAPRAEDVLPVAMATGGRRPRLGRRVRRRPHDRVRPATPCQRRLPRLADRHRRVVRADPAHRCDLRTARDHGRRRPRCGGPRRRGRRRPVAPRRRGVARRPRALGPGRGARGGRRCRGRDEPALLRRRQRHRRAGQAGGRGMGRARRARHRARLARSARRARPRRQRRRPARPRCPRRGGVAGRRHGRLGRRAGRRVPPHPHRGR